MLSPTVEIPCRAFFFPKSTFSYVCYTGSLHRPKIYIAFSKFLIYHEENNNKRHLMVNYEAHFVLRILESLPQPSIGFKRAEVISGLHRNYWG